MARKITMAEIETRAHEIAAELRADKFVGRSRDENNNRVQREARVYGIPRGGVPCALALAGALNGIVVDDIEDANIVVDDIIDSGKTKLRYMEKAKPGTVFKAFYMANKEKEWLVFPWEGDEHSSAEDIPVRLLQYVGEKPERGGLLETPKRFLKAWQHYTSGYKKNAKDILKVFKDGADKCDEMVLVRSIPVYSHCEHHLAPFFGVAHVAYIPDGSIVGLSKLSRLVDIYARRLQVQERLTNQIADALQDNLKPKGVAVMIECRHMCMESRGVQQQGSSTITSAMRGVFRNSGPRAEFLNFIKEK